jgi:glycogen(starch) synthase
MRILVISNLYPPHHVGGYEICCKEAVDRLRKRGHEVWVLTSDYDVKAPEKEKSIYRQLAIDLGAGGTQFGGRFTDALARTVGLLRREVCNRRVFRRIAKAFRPDLVYLWNLTHISASLGMQAANMGLRTCYYVGDLWLSNWRSDSWLAIGAGTFPVVYPPPTRFVSGLARMVFKGSGLGSTRSLDLRHVQFVSHYLKNQTLKAGESVAEADVVNWGIDLGMFPVKPDHDGPLKMLFVGQLVFHKGLHTAVEALAKVKARNGYGPLRLSIVGGSVTPDYVTDVRAKVRALGLEDNVEFLGQFPREQLPQIYRRHDILLFPSICDEGLGMSMLEAMASGLVVVGTASGGSGDALVNERTGLVFPKEDAAACAEQVIRLIEDRALYNRLRRDARRAIEAHFEIEKIMNRVETSLRSALDDEQQAQTGKQP